MIYPGHGPVIDDPAAKIAEYIEHRESRELRLVEALDAGERSRMRLLERVWDDVPTELRPMAAYAMQAHVEKLAEEGRLVQRACRSKAPAKDAVGRLRDRSRAAGGPARRPGGADMKGR